MGRFASGLPVSSPGLHLSLCQGHAALMMVSSEIRKCQSFYAIPLSFSMFIFIYFWKKHLFGCTWIFRYMDLSGQDLVSWPEMEPRPPALGLRSLSHRTTREVPIPHFIYRSSVDKHLSSFCFLALMNNAAAMNIFVQVLHGHMFSLLLGVCLGLECDNPNVIRSEVGQTQKGECHMISLLCGIQI